MMPKMLERLTMWASRWRARCGRKARVPCTTPQKLMFISHSICAWSISAKVPIRATPALLTTMLRPGCADVAACAKPAIWLGLADVDAMHRDLARTCRRLPVVSAISAASVCSPASSRSASARSQPRAASSSASARPMPLAAPVTAAAAPRIAVMSCQLHAKVGVETLIRPTRFGNRTAHASAVCRRVIWADDVAFTACGCC